MPTLDLHLLDRRYRDLRAVDPARQARLVAATTAEGQRTPVLVVPVDGGRYVLICEKRLIVIAKIGPS